MNLDQQLSLLLHGTDKVYSPHELKSRLEHSAKTGRQLRIKLGMDPTAPDLHLGHAVVLRKLRQFQNLGHKAVLIIGDATAMIGDPTGKTKTRPILSPEQVQQNAATYFSQAGKILDLSPEKLEIRHNSEWLHKMSFTDALKLLQRMTVARMLQRDTFHDRHTAGEAIYIHEFMYPLMQGWDSVQIHADVELGGTDQTFNNLVGRDLQQQENQPPQIVIIMPILVGTDGVHKMGKSLGNFIGVCESPKEQFGKTMSIPDTAMETWFHLCTPLPDDRIASLINPNETHPRQAKEILGKMIVEQFHSPAAAEAAAADFAAQFTKGQLPADLQTISIPASLLANGQIGLLTLIKHAGFAASTTEARRLVEGGGVTLAGEKITDHKTSIPLQTLQSSPILKVGKRHICKLSQP